MVHAQLEVSAPEDQVGLLDRDISSTYVLTDKRCGTANSALHKRVSTQADVHLPPPALLLDPTRRGEPSHWQGSFVFSTSTRRYEYGETRPIIASLEPKWRQSDVQGTQNVKCVVPCRWAETADVKLAVSVYHRSALCIHLRLHTGGVWQGRSFCYPIREPVNQGVSRVL